MNNKGVLTECETYKIAVPNGTTVTQTLLGQPGIYLMTLSRYNSTQEERAGAWLLTTGTTYGNILPIATGTSVTTPTISGRTVTVTGNTTQLQAIFRRIG